MKKQVRRLKAAALKVGERIPEICYLADDEVDALKQIEKALQEAFYAVLISRTKHTKRLRMLKPLKGKR